MSKHEVAPDVLAEALALREVGYTTLAISQRLGISVRTLHRHFASTGTKKGRVKDDLLQQAKEGLLAHITSNEAIKQEAARLIVDDLAHARHLRELMLEASELMKATSLREAALVMRAAAAYSTALKNTSDVIRHGLPVEKAVDSADDLPELVVTELTKEDIAVLRRERIADEVDEQDVEAILV